VQNTAGAAFHSDLDVACIDRVFPKGTDPGVDSYSGLFDNGKRKSTGLGEWLRAEGVREVTVLGLATDYCVKATALDARAAGFEVTLVEDGCRGVGLGATDIADALAAMRAAGVRIV
jgi:nicotinamidase/pyrazinamidase